MFNLAVKLIFSYFCCFLLSLFITWNWVDPFTGEQAGKYGGGNGGRGNGYKGENKGNYTIGALVVQLDNKNT